MVVLLVSVWKCSLSRADSYRQCSSLTALLYSDCHPWRKTHLRRKSLTVFLKQTHTHTITESSDSLGVSLTHTSVIHVSTVFSCWPECFVHFNHQSTKNDFLYLNHKNKSDVHDLFVVVRTFCVYIYNSALYFIFTYLYMVVFYWINTVMTNEGMRNHRRSLVLFVL